MTAVGTSRALRWAGAALVIAALAALVWAHRGELPATGRALRDSDHGWLAVGVTALVWWTLPARAVDWVLRRPAREHNVTGADELYDAVGLLRRRPVAVLPAVGCAVVIDLLGVVMLWAALAAVGGGNRPVVALVAYAISTLFGIVGVLPGGLMFVEVGAVAVLVSFDTAVGVAAAAVVVFRVLQFWLPLAVGLAVSWWLRRRGTARGRRVAEAPA